MKNLTLLLLSVAGCALANTCTLTLSADTNLSATTTSWTGTGCTTSIPGAGDTTTITGAHLLTVDQAWTIGNDSATFAIVLQGGANIRFAANTTLEAAGLQLNGTGGVGWEVYATSSPVTLTCQSNTVVCNIDHHGTSGQNSKTAKLTGTSWTAPAILTHTTIGAAAAGTILGTAGTAPELMTVRWGEWLNPGAQTTSNYVVGNDWNQALVNNNSGQLIFNYSTSGDFLESFQNMDFRNCQVTSGNCYVFRSGGALGAKVRQMINVTFQGLSTTSAIPLVIMEMAHATLKNIIFDNILTSNGGANLTAGQSWSDILLTGTRPVPWLSAPTGILFTPQNGGSLNGYIDATFCTQSHAAQPQGCEEHRLQESGSSGGLAETTFTRLLIDGFNNAGTGDTLLNSAAPTMSQAIIIRQGGNLFDGYGNPAVGATGITLNHWTSYAASVQPSGVGLEPTNLFTAVILEERQLNGTQTLALTNGICNTEYACVAQNNSPANGGGTAFVPLSAVTIDYNNYYAMSGLTNYYLDANGNNTYMSMPNALPRNSSALTVDTVSGGGGSTQVVTTTGTWPAGTMAGDVMCISATGTNSSMYLQATKCAVINSKDSTTQVTLGNQMGAQTLGVTGAAGGQSIYVYECYFSDGTSYGASGRGSHDIYGDPQFVSTRNISTFSQDILGNVGTDQQLYNGFHDAMILMNGWDESTPPARVTPNPAANWEQVWQYITEGYTPKNRALWCAGNDGESMGAVKFCGRGKALQGATLSGM